MLKGKLYHLIDWLLTLGVKFDRESDVILVIFGCENQTSHQIMQ